MRSIGRWCALLIVLSGLLLPAEAASPPVLLRLSRGAIDPLSFPQTQALADSAELLIVQFDHQPTSQDMENLWKSGMQPLLYVPDQAWLVRRTGTAPAATLANVRWMGAVDPAFKRAATLDRALLASTGSMRDLAIATPPATDPAALLAFLQQRGGSVVEQNKTVMGMVVHTRISDSHLAALLARDDVLWVEPVEPITLFDEQAREIVGASSINRPSWLDGSGQIVAVTDSGLDVQNALSADFAGRVLRGFAPSEMSASCAVNEWSDRNGHGTHVAGTILGSGALSNGQYAGIAPGAKLVVQNTSTGGNALDCLPSPSSYLQSAYATGARVQNGSFGTTTGSLNLYGGYTTQDQQIDNFLWQNQDHLFAVAAGNGASDANLDGKVDRDSIASPGTAKNVLTVGASENNRPPTAACSATTAPNLCYRNFASFAASVDPIRNDPISDQPNGLAAFSGRGPTDDGRLKPELVAPGTNIISTRSHHPNVNESRPVGDDYAFRSGTSMATPLVAGMAVLTRQWLAEARNWPAPSAALVRALLLNGASDMQPGQYGTGSTREIGSAWPNPEQGWGRVDLNQTLGLANDRQIWFREHSGVQTDDLVTFRLQVASGEPLRVTLSWSDYPGTPFLSRSIMNNLNLEVEQPNGTILLGNATADLISSCREVGGTDICNTSESIEIATPMSGLYKVRVRAAWVVPVSGSQPFAVVARAATISDADVPVPTLAATANPGLASVRLSWNAIDAATQYQVEASQDPTMATGLTTYTATAASLTVVQPLGVRYYRVRACQSGGCGLPSAIVQAETSVAPRLNFLPLVVP